MSDENLDLDATSTSDLDATSDLDIYEAIKKVADGLPKELWYIESYSYFLKSKKYLLQTKTPEQSEFLLKFMRFVCALSENATIRYNSKQVPYIQDNLNVGSRSVIKCCLYKENVHPAPYNLCYRKEDRIPWIKKPDLNEAVYVTIKYKRFIGYRDIPNDTECNYHHIWHRPYGKKLAYRISYIKELMRFFYSKAEFYEKINWLPKDINGVIFEYLGIVDY